LLKIRLRSASSGRGEGNTRFPQGRRHGKISHLWKFGVGATEGGVEDSLDVWVEGPGPTNVAPAHRDFDTAVDKAFIARLPKHDLLHPSRDGAALAKRARTRLVVGQHRPRSPVRLRRPEELAAIFFV
jgi:hypothetical protein